MATSLLPSISALPRGHDLPPVTFTITRSQAAAYCAAIGDTSSYADAVPPLAAVALALAAVQTHVRLPEGALHTGQEVAHEAALPVEAPLELHARIAQRSERQGFVISVIELEVVGPRGGGELRARTTIMAPAEAT